MIVNPKTVWTPIFFSVNMGISPINLKTSKIKPFVTKIPRSGLLLHYTLQCNLRVCLYLNIQSASHISLLYDYHNWIKFRFENILHPKIDLKDTMEIPLVIPKSSKIQRSILHKIKWNIKTSVAHKKISTAANGYCVPSNVINNGKFNQKTNNGNSVNMVNGDCINQYGLKSFMTNPITHIWIQEILICTYLNTRDFNIQQVHSLMEYPKQIKDNKFEHISSRQSFPKDIL